ncbi:MAG TPA: AtpZ/AtpI family protein [Gemmatimonadales bacterium]|nr:AtpZ/AtpI family protein [Gemmatimonadales bacterium]
MKTSQGSGSGFGLGHKYLGLGLRFAGGVIIFMLAGLALDRWQGWTPVGTITGTLAGSVLAFLSVYRELMADEAKARQRRSAEGDPPP